jgi:drug/metabolite transporter (DMT)-like permease
VNRSVASLLLLLAALIWGAGFLAQKHASTNMGPVSFVGARFLLSWALLAPLALYEHRKESRPPLTIRDFGIAGLIGLCLFVGAILQQSSLLTTTTTNVGFLTALSVIFVPAIVWAMSGARPKAVVLVAIIICLVGSWLVTEHGHFHRWTRGDVLVVIADVAWAGVITLTPLFLNRVPRPFLLAFMQFGVVALLGLALGASLEPVSEQNLASAFPAILYSGAISGALAFTLQITAQKYVPATQAALILSLESVFAAVAGAFLLSERLTGLAALGCALILLGVLIAEAGPSARALMRRANRLNLRYSSAAPAVSEELAVFPAGVDPD